MKKLADKNKKRLAELKLSGGLNPTDAGRLKELIAIVKQTEAAFVQCGIALIEIREDKLWIEFPTFTKFCEFTFGWGIRRAQHIIKASKTVLELPEHTRTMVRSERVARALLEAPKEAHASIIKHVASEGEITAKKVEVEISKLKQEEKIKTLDQLGHEVPKLALIFWNRRDEPSEIARMISNARSAVRKLQDTTDKLYVEVNMNEVLACLSKAYTEFKQSIPYAVCPYCQGKQPKACTFCKGRGVVSKFRYDMAAEELKKKENK